MSFVKLSGAFTFNRGMSFKPDYFKCVINSGFLADYPDKILIVNLGSKLC